MSKGFASLSKERRRAISEKGGRFVQLRGTGHSYNPLNAKAAAEKSLTVRRKKLAKEAALRLLKMGFTAEQLHRASLSAAELIYFGGSKRSKKRIQELADRINDDISSITTDIPEVEGDI